MDCVLLVNIAVTLMAVSHWGEDIVTGRNRMVVIILHAQAAEDWKLSHHTTVKCY